jgi:hypothetical protein
LRIKRIEISTTNPRFFDCKDIGMSRVEYEPATNGEVSRKTPLVSLEGNHSPEECTPVPDESANETHGLHSRKQQIGKADYITATS